MVVIIGHHIFIERFIQHYQHVLRNRSEEGHKLTFHDIPPVGLFGEHKPYDGCITINGGKHSVRS